MNERELMIQKALDTLGGSALIPEALNPVLSELAIKLNPLVAMMDLHQIESDTYKFSQRTAHTSQSSISGEKATTLSGDSTYNRVSVDLQVLKLKGGVTGKQKASSRSYIDSYKSEIVGHTEKLMYDLEAQVLWGCTSAAASDLHSLTGDAYQMDGFEVSLPLASKRDGIGVVALSDLDTMIDYTNGKGARGDKMAFMMSSSMLSKVSSLQTQIFMPITEVEVEGGWRFATYRRIPIIESSYCATPGTTGAVAATKAAGGSLADDEYFYRVAAVTDEGEMVAGTEDSDTTETTNNTVGLAWTAVTGALLYKVFRSLTTGTGFTLLDVIPARTYDSDGNVTGNVTTYDDDGTITPDGQTTPLEATEESIFLIDLHPDKGSQIPYTNENPSLKNIITFEELAKTDDKQEFLVKCYPALAVRNPNVSMRARNVKII